MSRAAADTFFRVRTGPSGGPSGLRVYVRDRLALCGTIVLIVVAICALWPASDLPQSPYAADLTRALMPPFWRDGSSLFMLGTDQFGRDVLSRVIYGTRFSISIALGAACIGGVVGTVLGVTAGFYGGAVDAVIMRLADVQLAFPLILLVIAVLAVVGPSVPVLIVVLGTPSWAGYARMMRGGTLALRERQFIEAARATGCGTWRVVLRHVIPNLRGSLIILTTFEIGRLLLLESAVSFLGLGIQPPTPSWGTMIADGREHIFDGWWLAAIPGAAITIVVLAFNLVGDGLRDLLDPRAKRDTA
jgi:peptide/nickel transport system permease protein